jgi:hypothetical protein
LVKYLSINEGALLSKLPNFRSENPVSVGTEEEAGSNAPLHDIICEGIPI